MVVNCPKCGKKTALINDTCEHCGIKVKHCEECGNIVEESQTQCDYCGYSFETVKEDQVEKVKGEMPKELKKTAVRLASFAEQENKKYHKISKVLSPIGWIIFFTGIFLPILIIKTTNPLDFSAIKTAKNLHKVFLVLSIIILFVASLFKELRTIFSASAIARQVKELKFDYEKYYLYDKAYNNILTTAFMDDVGEIQLILAIRYEKDSNAKIIKLIKQLGMLFCYLMICIFAYIGISSNMDAVFVSLLFNVSFKFNFNAQLILVVLFFVISWVLDWCFNKDMEDAAAWIEEIRKKQQ